MIKKLYQRFVSWLEQRLFPKVVAYATHPFVILLTMLLLIPLIAFASITSLALILGNYTNVVSAAVSSIVLATSMASHEHHKREIQRLHEKIDRLAPPAPEPTPSPTKPYRDACGRFVKREKEPTP